MRLCYGLLLVFVAACGSSTSYSSAPPPPPPGTPPPPPPPPPPPGTVAVKIQDFSFSPSSITIKVGTPVQWTNDGAKLHSVLSDSNVFASPYLSGPSTDAYGQPTGGQTYILTFSTVGTFPYHCGVHDYMKGTVTVTQ
jgi:plastocyanin